MADRSPGAAYLISVIATAVELLDRDEVDVAFDLLSSSLERCNRAPEQGETA
jgi:hypothetical protein